MNYELQHLCFHGTLIRAAYTYYRDHVVNTPFVVYEGRSYHIVNREKCFRHFPDFNMLESVFPETMVATNVHTHGWINPDPPYVRPILKTDRCFVPVLDPHKPSMLGFVQINTGPIGYYRLR